MTTTVQLIEHALTEAFHPHELEVFDDRAEHIGHTHQDSGHFTVVIKSSAFAEKNTIERHRMVYAALGTLMQTHIHALRIQAAEV
ncbi:MAG: BolA family transcriptional regulator [Gammaproteobacteria bacterium CG_4_10_14_0_8_um_filter_38_16]|nr:MAG: BolA family transcriptional regulator [Gammaproteobacteria bacterium CG_4_10_14_0_8_um_filter_38_16]PJA03080.1 MAG: BolA family transcriptional regulator [Gammaproteobacteria bacterium CG_4_10_14_0_2_um_filter_38_22]PJB10130.1 MAG: BolA family transcriptional regulator [Gammaproteobacteria bacterium CG_4_9_14_3_um_filter_38_9]